MNYKNHFAQDKLKKYLFKNVKKHFTSTYLPTRKFNMYKFIKVYKES